MRERHEIKELAREQIRAQRAPAILLIFVYALMAYASALLDRMAGRLGGSVAYWIIYSVGMLILGVLWVNLSGEYVKIYEGRRATVGEIFTGCGKKFFRKMGGYLWMTLWLLLWALPGIVVHVWTNILILAILLYIPVFIRAMAYFMTPYILGYHTEVKATLALRLSKRMTKGYMGRIVVMYLSFIGWIILGVLPFLIFTFYGAAFGYSSGNFYAGIVTIYIGALGSVALFIVLILPYMHVTIAGLFIELRDDMLAKGLVSWEELGMPRPIVVTPVAEAPQSTPPVVEAVTVELAPEEGETDELSEDEVYGDEDEDDLTDEES